MTDAKKLFEILVNENAAMLTTYLRAAVRDPAGVDDLFQETMLTAWRRLDDYDTARPFGPWLRGIAAKLVLVHYRRVAKQDEPCGQEVLDQLESRFAGLQRLPGDTFDDKLDALRHCVELLPEKYREPVELRYRKELDMPTTAERLSLGLETLKKRLQRAKHRLLDCMTRRMVAADANQP